MDAIAGMADRVDDLARRARRDPLLNIYPELRDKLTGTPRYLFDDRATETAVEITVGRPKVLREALRHLVIPYPAMWIEWRDGARQRLRDCLEVEERPLKEIRPLPSRVGFLVEAAPGGRKGTATWVWSNNAGDPALADVPAIGQIQPYFDLDRDFGLPELHAQALGGSNLWKTWQHSAIQTEALRSIWRTAEHHPSTWGQHYLDVTQANDAVQALFYSDVVGELIQMYACLLLLTASRPVFDYTPVRQDKLNKARRKSGKTPLLDHTKATLHLTPQAERPIIVRGPLGHARKSPRVHLVSTYLATRGNKHWTVSPYVRGKGEWVHRQVQVRG